MNRYLENQFFREYQHGGAAILALKMALWKYCGVGSDVPGRPDFPEGVLAEIKLRTEKNDVWPWYGLENYCPLMDEIIDNLDSCISDNVRRNYVIEILKKFQNWTTLYSLAKEKLDAISNIVVLYSLEYFFLDWRNAFVSFAEKLAVALAMRGLNIIEIQSESGISIIEKLCVDDLWVTFGTRRLAEKCLSNLNNHITCNHDQKYQQVLRLIRETGRSFEKLPNNYIDKDEEGIRDAFLPTLKTHFKDCVVVGEAYNRNGKTDILVIQSTDHTNIFIGECKFWRGKQHFSKAIDQLFDNYLTWHDTRSALLIFVKNNIISKVMQEIHSECVSHKYFVKDIHSPEENSFSFIFHLPGDDETMIQLEVIVFHFNKKSQKRKTS